MSDWFGLNEPGRGPEFTGEGDFHPLFSNFANSPVTIDGERYPTIEHYFQAMKAESPIWRAYIRTANGPGQAKVRGREAPLRGDWDKVRVGVMLTGLRFKFAGDPYRRVLEQFRGPVVEWNSWHDRVWGVCLCPPCKRTGLNLLGYCLERVRSELLADGGRFGRRR